MEIHPVGSELFHADEQTDGHDVAHSSPFITLQKRLKLVKIPRYVILDYATAQ